MINNLNFFGNLKIQLNYLYCLCVNELFTIFHTYVVQTLIFSGASLLIASACEKKMKLSQKGSGRNFQDWWTEEYG